MIPKTTQSPCCETCGNPAQEGHRCPPRWVVFAEDEPDYRLTFYDQDPDTAAEMFVESIEDVGEQKCLADQRVVIVVQGEHSEHLFQPRYEETITWYMDYADL